ncbi:MAG TPA: adenylate/guanylate cyclase domain-containing protein [Candidatus Binataceae bacterium]|nr:adenylate/guanylate cyclase domain-containing protein [Candidatus Binataceae bacterium]
MEAPIKYFKCPDGVHLAYRIFGDGPRDIVLVPGTLSHAEMTWERPAYKHLLDRLTAFARVIVFDKRGQGLSDRNVAAEQTIEERIIDIKAVMDAAGSERASIYGWSEGGPTALVFSATYPERTSALVLYATFASLKDPPWSISRELWFSYVKSWEEHWGTGILLELNAPSVWVIPAVREETGRWERATASPGSIGALMRLNYDIDTRHVLPVIQAPTLVLHRKDDSLVPSACGRYIAEHIAGARYIEMPGTDHSIFDRDSYDFVADQIEEFLTGQHHYHEPDRVLATVMFSDIVESTRRAAELGDARWRHLLDQWYATVRNELSAFRGREIGTAGDGILATFDGPARAIRCASAIRSRVRSLGLQVRTGLHTGECELVGDNVVGIAVHIGARVASLADPDEVLVSSTVKDLVAGAGLKFGDRGAHTLKGVPDQWRLYAVQS